MRFFTRALAALEYLSPVWFVPVMGWCGLAQAWLRAGDYGIAVARPVAIFAGGVATCIFLLMGLLCIFRWLHHRKAVIQDTQHPIRHAFMATLPISIMLLATLAIALFWNQSPVVDGWLRMMWGVGALLEMATTVWVATKWLQAQELGGPTWNAITPILFIPVVGNVLAPLGGVVIGYDAWAMAQFGVGLFLWPVLQTLLVARWVHVGPLPDRMTPALFIMVVPPCIVGLELLQMHAPVAWVWCLWGIGAFFLSLTLTQMFKIKALSFGMSHWGMSFPIAAFTIFTLQIGMPSGDSGWVAPALALLAITTALVLGLTLATLRGLMEGTLLVPEAD